jgi:hypothetical protein
MSEARFMLYRRYLEPASTMTRAEFTRLLAATPEGQKDA